MFTLIRFQLTNKKTGAQVPCWLETASFVDTPSTDGTGLKVKRMTVTRDKDKAARFSPASAYAIAVQFSSPATLETPTGTVLPETEQLQAEQEIRTAQFRQLDRELAEALGKMLKGVLL